MVTISAEEYGVEGTSGWVPLTDKKWPIPSGHSARIVSMTLMKTLWIQPKGSPRTAGQRIYSTNGRNQSTYRCRSFEWGQICPPPKHRWTTELSSCPPPAPGCPLHTSLFICNVSRGLNEFLPVTYRPDEATVVEAESSSEKAWTIYDFQSSSNCDLP